MCAGKGIQHVIDQTDLCSGVQGAQAQGAELRAGERHGVVIVAQAAEQGIDGTDQGLYFWGGVHIRADQCGTGQGLLDEGQIAIDHTAHIGLREGAQHRQGSGVVLCVITDHGQCRGVGVHARSHSSVQIGHAVDGRVVGAAITNRVPDVGQRLWGGLGDAQQSQVFQGQGLRRTAQAVDGSSQGVKLHDRVDFDHGFAADHVVVQSQAVGVGGNAAQVHAQR